MKTKRVKRRPIASTMKACQTLSKSRYCKELTRHGGRAKSTEESTSLENGNDIGRDRINMGLGNTDETKGRFEGLGRNDTSGYTRVISEAIGNAG